MITLPQYQVLGGDGREYGPVYDDQIRQWIAEGRLESKSPVKPPDAKDWVFLETLPEFAEALQAFETPEPPPPGAPGKLAAGRRFSGGGGNGGSRFAEARSSSSLSYV